MVRVTNNIRIAKRHRKQYITVIKFKYIQILSVKIA